MPGFVDSHVHFILGSLRMSQVYLKDARDEAEFTHRIAQKARDARSGRGFWAEPGMKRIGPVPGFLRDG